MVRLPNIGFSEMSEWKKWAVYGFVFGVVISILYSSVDALNFITMPLVSIPIILLIGAIIFNIVVLISIALEFITLPFASIPIILLIGATIFNIVALISALIAPIISTAIFYMLVGIFVGLLYEWGYITARTIGGIAVIGLMALVIMQTVNMFNMFPSSPERTYVEEPPELVSPEKCTEGTKCVNNIVYVCTEGVWSPYKECPAGCNYAGTNCALEPVIL